MSHIKLHGNPKTNIKAKTNRNRNLQKTLKKTWKKCKKNNCAHREADQTGVVQCEHCTTEVPRLLILVLIFYLLTYIAKQNKTNTDTNPTTNPNHTIDEAGKRKVTE